MSAGANQVDSANAIRARLASLDGARPEPGTLTKWADADNNTYWEFVGNGETSSTDFVQTALQRESQEGNLLAEPVAQNRAFAAQAATTLLATEAPDAPIPRGEVKELALRDLLKLITPFLQSYAAGQKRATTSGTSGPSTGDLSEDERQRVATGQVVSLGLTLPLD